MRRLPVYFLLDISESMVGEPIRQVEEGLTTIVRELRSDPYALETVWLSIIGFAGKPMRITPLMELPAQNYLSWVITFINQDFRSALFF